MIRLKAGMVTCHFVDTWQEKELKDVVSVYNEKSTFKTDLVGKLLEVRQGVGKTVGEIERKWRKKMKKMERKWRGIQREN